MICRLKHAKEESRDPDYMASYMRRYRSITVLPDISNAEYSNSSLASFSMTIRNECNHAVSVASDVSDKEDEENVGHAAVNCSEPETDTCLSVSEDSSGSESELFEPDYCKPLHSSSECDDSDKEAYETALNTFSSR